MGYIALGDLISKAQVEKCGKREYPVLSMTMHDGIVFQNDRFKKDIASIDRSNYSVVGFNQLVVSFPIDEGVLAVQDITDAGIVSPAYKIWDIDQAKLVPKYLEMWLRSPRSIDYYKSKLRGTTARRRSIPEEDFLGMRVNVLPMEEQERIVDLITRVNGVILLRKQQLSALDDLIKARFVEMFGDLADPACVWQTCRLVDSCGSNDDIKCGPFGTQLSKDEYQSNGVPVWEIPQINSAFAIPPEHFLTEAKAKELQAYTLTPGDIVMSRKGNVGKCALFPEDKESGVLHSDVLRIRVSVTKANPCFMMYQLHYSRDVIRQIEQVSSGAIMAGVNVTKLKEILVKLPPLGLQEQFAAFVAQIDKSKSVIQKSLDETQLLFDSLMQQYFG